MTQQLQDTIKFRLHEIWEEERAKCLKNGTLDETRDDLIIDTTLFISKDGFYKVFVSLQSKDNPELVEILYSVAL